MLQSLHISNLAVIASADVELSGRLNAFTGATGAGKSLVIGALEVLLGLRTAGELLRPGAEEGRVSGMFHIADDRKAADIRRLADVELEGGELLITRRIFSTGRTAATANGQPITIGMLKEIAELLVDIHGQHDHQYLLKAANQLDLLDEFADLVARRDALEATYQRWRELRGRRDELSTSAELRRQQLELAEFQANEIDEAELADGELEALENEHRRHQNVRKLMREAGEIYAALYDAEGSLVERLSHINAILRELLLLDEQLKNPSNLLGSALAELEEASFDLRRYVERLDADPERAGEVEQRLNLIHRMTDKYGRTIADVLLFRDELEGQLKSLRAAESDFGHIDRDLAAMESELLAAAESLHDDRRKAAARLAKGIESQLEELGMGKAKVSIDFDALPDAPADRLERMGPTGIDAIEMMVVTNPGQPARPLRKIASGGELSRIMLAIKSMLARSDRISVLVFDEIDANVGGRLGSVIGGKLSALGRSHQVLCITHLPQIAAWADRQITVRKEVVGKMTETTVRPIDGEERVAELAEMIGGTHVTETTRKQAEELLAQARPSEPASAGPRKRRK